MNCANHSDLPVSAYCQNCGKPLCTQCVRSVAGVVYCEPCLAMRLQPSGTSYSSRATAGTPSGATSPGSASWSAVPPVAAFVPPGARGGTSPVLAGFLGAIPGVGAMYNGQFVKAFAHVIIFVVLIGVANHFDPAGMLVAAWIFYQVFDAVQTAIARRDGRPLPDPFGLNDLGQRLGMQGAPAYTAPYVGAVVPPAVPQPSQETSGGEAWAAQPASASGAAVPPVGGASPDWDAYAQRAAAAHAEAATRVPFTASEYNPGAAYSQGQAYNAAVPIPPMPPGAFHAGRPEPIGAIVLIGVGMLFLLSTLGVFRMDWVGRGWPVLIIVIGAGLLFSRLRANRRMGGGR